MEGDFHLVGRLTRWANSKGGVRIGVTGLAVVEGFVWLATVYLVLAHVALILVILVRRIPFGRIPFLWVSLPKHRSPRHEATLLVVNLLEKYRLENVQEVLHCNATIVSAVWQKAASICELPSIGHCNANKSGVQAKPRARGVPCLFDRQLGLARIVVVISLGRCFTVLGQHGRAWQVRVRNKTILIVDILQCAGLWSGPTINQSTRPLAGYFDLARLPIPAITL